jgi:hypothetical protein
MTTRGRKYRFKIIMIQLELFLENPKAHLFPYWWKRLRQWPRLVMEHRRDTESSGWGAAELNGWFADLLHKAGQMSQSEYSRWQRFERRVYSWRGAKHHGR